MPQAPSISASWQGGRPWLPSGVSLSWTGLVRLDLGGGSGLFSLSLGPGSSLAASRFWLINSFSLMDCSKSFLAMLGETLVHDSSPGSFMLMKSDPR